MVLKIFRRGLLDMRTLTASVILIAFAIACWLLWRGRSAEDLTPAVTFGTQDLTQSARPAEEGGVLERESVPASSQETTRAEAPDGIVLEVLDGDTSTPVLGALVVVVAESQLPGEPSGVSRFARSPWWAELADLSVAFPDAGERHLTDDSGSVRVPEPSGVAYAWASQGDRRGIARIKASLKPQTIRIFEGGSLLATVVDRSGQPLPEIPVRLVVAHSQNMTDKELFVGVPAPGSSVVTIPEVYLRLALTGYVADISKLYLVPKVTLFAGPGEEVFRGDLPAEPVRVVAPPTGRVRVEVRDPEGRPYQGEAGVMAHWKTDRKKLVEERESVPCVQGVSVFPFVMLNAPFNAKVRFARESGFEALELHHPGIDAGQDEITIVARLSSPETTSRVLEGRLFGADGALLKSTPCAVQPVPSVGFWDLTVSRPTFTTDEQGRFRYVIPSSEKAGSLSIYRADPDPHRYLDQAWRLDVSIPRPESVGLFDLGDVTMAEVPVLVAGSVKNERGHPLPGVRVSATVKPAKRDELAWLQGASSKRDDGEYRFGSTTGGDGRFGLYTELGASGGSLTLHLEGYRPILSRPFVRGETDLQLVLGSGCQLAGRLLLDDGIAARHLSVMLHGPDQTRYIMAGQEGRFVQPGLPAGEYAFEVSIRGEDEPLYREGPIRLAEDQDRADQEITIDLRGKILLCLLEVLSEDGSPIRGARVVCPDRERPATDEKGRASLPTSTPVLHCVVSAEGYQHRLVSLGPGLTTVTMRRGIPLRIDVDADEVPLPDGMTPICGIFYSPGAGDRLGPFRRWLEYPVREVRGENVEWTVAEPGRYVVKFGVEVRVEQIPREFFADSLNLPVEVVESKELQTFSARITQEQIEAALREGAEAFR
ncbi:MAG: hypothetical protein V2A76_08590 [Planctomycetota bacterium]